MFLIRLDSCRKNNPGIMLFSECAGVFFESRKGEWQDSDYFEES